MPSKTRGLRAMVSNRLRAKSVYSQPGYWDAKAIEDGPESASGWINKSLNAIYHERESALLLRYFPDVLGSEVLDVGCGTGRIARHFAKRGARVTGIDFSSRVIDLARQKKLEGNVPSPTYRIESVLDLNEQGRYDAIVMFGVLCVACPDEAALRKALENAHRALSPNGVLLLAEPLHRGMLGLALRAGFRQVVRVMIEVGFQIDDVAPLHFWPFSRPLSYLPVPERVTRAIYAMGEVIMRAVRIPGAGDYKVIVASRSSVVCESTQLRIDAQT